MCERLRPRYTKHASLATSISASLSTFFSHAHVTHISALHPRASFRRFCPYLSFSHSSSSHSSFSRSSSP